MKTTVIAATIALGLTAGTALADQPMVLTDAQLDRVTGGAVLAEYVIVPLCCGTDEEWTVQFTAADLALWYLSFTMLGLEPMAVTSDLSITFLRPAVGGDILAEAFLLRSGRTRLHGRVDLRVEGHDRLVAHATGGYALFGSA